MCLSRNFFQFFILYHQGDDETAAVDLTDLESVSKLATSKPPINTADVQSKGEASSQSGTCVLTKPTMK